MSHWLQRWSQARVCAADRPGPEAFEPALNFPVYSQFVVLSSSAKSDRIKDVPTFVSGHARTRQHQSGLQDRVSRFGALHFG